MFRSRAIELSLAIMALIGMQAVSAHSQQARPAKPAHARTVAQPNMKPPAHGPSQDEKRWMDRASEASNGGGGGGM